MQFFVGYQLRQDERFLNAILSRRAQICEVYFSWGQTPNGRSSAAQISGLTPWQALDRQREDLRRIHAAGIGLNLLLNANCYGGGSLSRAFYRQTGDLVDELLERYALRSVTTTSPVIAKFLKQNFPELELRASVNMEIGTPEGVDYLSEWFDGFYARRELNRDLPRLRAFSAHCRKNGKRVYMLANSGCLSFCSARQFHDNLVAHEHEIAAMDNAFDFHGVCRDFLGREGNRMRLLQVSNWVRPEDMGQFEGVVDAAKLATRVSRNPELILLAYTSGNYSGNLLQLTEPDFSALYQPLALDNHSLPEDFFVRTNACPKNCAACGFCERAMQRALRRMDGGMLLENTETGGGINGC